jgi:hypothetical protein
VLCMRVERKLSALRVLRLVRSIFVRLTITREIYAGAFAINLEGEGTWDLECCLMHSC